MLNHLNRLALLQSRPSLHDNWCRSRTTCWENCGFLPHLACSALAQCVSAFGSDLMSATCASLPALENISDTTGVFSFYCNYFDMSYIKQAVFSILHLVIPIIMKKTMMLTCTLLHINYGWEPNWTDVLDINAKLLLFPLTPLLLKSWLEAGSSLLAYFSAVPHCCSSSQSLEEEKVLREKCFPRGTSKTWSPPDSQHSEE